MNKKVWVSYRRLKSGKWKIRFRSPGLGEAGVTLPKNKQEKKVIEKVGWYRIEIDAGRFDPWEDKKKSIPIEAAVQGYLANGKGKKWNDKTYQGVSFRLNRMMDVLGRTVKVDRVKDWDWFSDLPYAPHSKEDFFSTTRAFLNWCKKQGYLQKFNVELPLQVRKELKQKKVKYITWSQLDQLASGYLALRQESSKFDYRGYEPERHTRLWWVMFWQLLRKEEAGALTHSSIRKDKMYVEGKGGTRKEIPIVPPAKPHIEWFLANPISDTLFGFQSMDSPTTQLRKAIIDVFGEGFPSKGFHQLRHGGIVHYLTAGKPLIYVSRLARHKSITTTANEYADIIEGMEGSAFEDILDEPLA